MLQEDYTKLVSFINEKYPKVSAVLFKSSFGGRLEIEVSNVAQAKALHEMYPKFNFTSKSYK
jgi:hypothetical protein